jgi:hypothetical protein
MESPPPLPAQLYVPALRQFIVFDAQAGGYVVDPDRFPDEEFLVHLSQQGLLGQDATSEDALYALVPLSRAPEPVVRNLVEGPRHAASSGVFTVEVGGGYDPIDPRGGHGPEGPRRI